MRTFDAAPLTKKEKAELERLSKLWATGRGTKKQILRCMQLNRIISEAASFAADFAARLGAKQ